MAKAPCSLRTGGILREIQVNLLECKVCFERFSWQQSERRPQNLTCGHVLCQECVQALSHPVLRKLECPFCRQLCHVDGTSHCRALTDLQELLLTRSPGPAAPRGVKGSVSRCGGLTFGALRLCSAFGGWGTLINPTGVAVFESSGTIMVVHDGDKRVAVFSPQGRRLHSFGPRGRADREICYPLDVAVSPSGYVVVTDAGNNAVKVFTSRGSHVMTVKGSFQLPWGVDIDSCGHILVSDNHAGTLSQVIVDYARGVTLNLDAVITHLQHPKEVACCRATGNIAVVESLGHDTNPTGNHRPTRLSVYEKGFHLLYQMDSFSMSLGSGVRLSASGVAFDKEGALVMIDSTQGMIWSLGRCWDSPVLTPLVGGHLVHPVGMAVNAANDSLIILDSGDHAVKIYSAQSGAIATI
ncbi:E3 ubiquitin-protein ligase NHLRC1-like [Lampris incognitus]|uniref:E3 ubiquitin-protein ligase NHLRC1-like n=1 Tax=Lampris incognitus TaxID=2546036 RepID=UPI0024B5ACD5|nr:E3 ubiquitin-protein ligase NHLRC1-like [Lampris incognitus]